MAVAQTCRSLHEAIVDSHTRKVKVTHFEVGSYSSRSASARIPHYVSRSLNSIHFPSLKTLELDFPRTKRRNASIHANDIDDACYSSFPIFVTNLSSAYNLQSLNLNASRLMVRADTAFQLEASYEIFADNLRRCTKLRELVVFNRGYVSGHEGTFYSVALLQAITGAVQMRKNNLDTLQMYIGGRPSDFLHNQYLYHTKRIDPVFDFFQAALTTKRLENLELILSDQHAHTLFEVLSSGGVARPRCIQRLVLHNYTSINTDLQPLPDSAHVLDFFSECSSLEVLDLDIPAIDWESERNTLALGRFLRHKLCLSCVIFSVRGESKLMLSVLLESLSPNIAENILHQISIYCLDEADMDQCIRFQSALKLSGMVCDTFRVEINTRGKWDIYCMLNRRLMEGESVPDAFDHFITTRYPKLERSIIL